jgi:glycosyltransferase involved in cell wall biosynthesis
MKLSIVVPVFNEEKTVAQVIERVRALQLPIEKEIIVVNDGSSDGTEAALRPFADLPDVRVHTSLVNLGKGASVRIGFKMARGDLIGIQDADLELDPSEYKRLLVPLLEGSAEVVYGSRFLEGGRKGQLPFYLANRGLSVLTNVLYGSRLTDIETCYKVFRREVLSALTLRAARFEIEPEVTAQILKRGFRIVELPIGYNPRSRAQGKKISWRDGFGAIYTLIDQRFKP